MHAGLDWRHLIAIANVSSYVYTGSNKLKNKQSEVANNLSISKPCIELSSLPSLNAVTVQQP